MKIKRYFFLLALVFLCGQCASLKKNETSGTFQDKRDEQTYKWIRLKDGRKWMAQNLNYQTDNSWCYDNEDSNCSKYGRLYSWESVGKACPDGWRLPTDNEWWEMTSYYGMAWNREKGQEENIERKSGNLAYESLIKGGDSGFSAELGGYHWSFEFFYLNSLGYYWTSTKHSYYFDISWHQLYRSSASGAEKFSCRCIQD